MDNSNELDQEQRIESLRRELQERLGGSPLYDSLPPEFDSADFEETLLRQMLEYQTSEPIAPFTLLQNAGVTISAPEQLDDTALPPKLKELIHQLASLGIYLQRTNHLSDRELYDSLYNDVLRNEARLFPENPNYVSIINLAGADLGTLIEGDADVDVRFYLTYYATKKERKEFARVFPQLTLPSRKNTPYDRDRFSPKPPDPSGPPGTNVRNLIVRPISGRLEDET
jgi:hypothetical protein